MPNLLGTAPNQVPTNADLGKLAFMDVVDTVTNNPYVDTAISDTKPSLLLDFANSKTLDPRITYTRASTATYYDGKTTAVAEQNLLTYSQDFGNAVWYIRNVAVTANATTAPDGTTTADTLTDNATSGPHSVSQGATTAVGTYTNSVYVKAGTASYALVQFRTANGNGRYSVIVDLSNGVVTATNSAGTVGGTNVVTNIGNGWYRVALTGTHYATTSLILVVGISDSPTPTFDADSYVPYVGTGSTIYVWGGQMEQRSAVTAYTPTTSSAITNYIPALQTAAAGVPRFDHDPVTGESKGFLIEEQRTNLLTYSHQFDNAAWGKFNTTVSANSVIAPDGSLTADKLIENSVTGQFLVRQLATVAAGVNTYTFYLKAAERRYANIYPQLVGDGGAIFDLVSGSVTWTAGPAYVSSSITSAGNGWFRCSVSVTNTAGSSYAYLYLGNSATTPAASYTGDGTSGIYIWGAQLEAGSFATSYIPTTSAQVTRSADAASMTGGNFLSWYRQDQGSLCGELAYSGVSASGWEYPIALSDGTAGNTIAFRRYDPTALVFRVDYGSTPQCEIGSVTPANGAFTKVAAAYATNDFSLSTNGGAVATDTSGSVPACSSLYLGSPAGVSKYFNGWMKRIAYYPKRLSDAELQEMTL